jgi:predicted O-methyltransferase YrrM
MPVTEFLNSKGFYQFEGYADIPKQLEELIQLTSRPNISIMEIGFNAGNSAELFLQNNSSATLTSFDIGIHSYVVPAKQYIDTRFPNRHTLILGDSTLSIPTYINNNPGKTFDVIFIDGGHDFTVANADITHCRSLAHKDTIVIVDDTVYTDSWKVSYTDGPTRAWLENLENKKIVEINRADYCRGKGMSWGKYVVI